MAPHSSTLAWKIPWTEVHTNYFNRNKAPLKNKWEAEADKLEHPVNGSTGQGRQRSNSPERMTQLKEELC